MPCRADSNSKQLDHRHDCRNLAVLLLVTSGIGVYLIATTVLIAGDGVRYIELARMLADRPGEVVRLCPAGYPALVFASHKVVSLLTQDGSVWGWIYSAQAVTLLCRLLAVIPLYLFGRMLVGASGSFWAMLILAVLPYPARFGSDVLRDWPYILFLATGLLLLLRAANRVDRWVGFGLVGLVSGLGHCIRPECAQVVLYGSLWLIYSLLRPGPSQTKGRLVLGMTVLLVGFLIPAGPHMWLRKRILPEKLDILLTSRTVSPGEPAAEAAGGAGACGFPAGLEPPKCLKALARLLEAVSENLMYYFVPALLIGLNHQFRRRRNPAGFLVIGFVLFNAVILILLYCGWGYISARHTLPLVVVTIPYVTVGLQTAAEWLASKRRTVGGWGLNRQGWFFALLVAGVVVSVPKLLRPLRADKRIYRDAAQWLAENSDPGDSVVVFDRRISFYAQRQGREAVGGQIPAVARYVVVQLAPLQQETAGEPPLPDGFVLITCWADRKFALAVYGLAERGTTEKRGD